MAFEQVTSVNSVELHVSDDVPLVPVVEAAVATDAEIDTELIAIFREQGEGIAEHVKLFGDGSQLEWRGAHFVLPLHADMHAGFLEALGLENYCPLSDPELLDRPATVVSSLPIIIESRELTAEVEIPSQPRIVLRRMASLSETPALPGQENNRKVLATLSYTALRREVTLNLVD